MEVCRGPSLKSTQKLLLQVPSDGRKAVRAFREVEVSIFEPRSVRARVASPIGTATIVAYADNEDSRLSNAMMNDLDCPRVIVRLSH
jgi:hypothetical protein